jgi:hypothetical protein
MLKMAFFFEIWHILRSQIEGQTAVDNWPKKHSSLPGKFCLHLRDISALGQYQRAIKTHFPI